MAAAAGPFRREPGEANNPASESSPAAAAPPRLTPLRELQLLDLWRHGGEAAQPALHELLRAYQRRIFSVCLRMVKNPEVAGDLTQDVLLKMIENLERYDGHSKLSTWVFRVTFNCCLSHLRRQKTRHHQSLERPPLNLHDPDSEPVRVGPRPAMEPSAAEGVQQSQQHMLVAKALDALDAETRAILLLRDVQDLDYQQLAEVFAIPVGTVKSRLFRARAALREALEALEGTDKQDRDKQ